MSKMLRKAIGSTGTCHAGEKCCDYWHVGGRYSGHKSKRLQRRIARRRENNNWKKENN